MNLRTASILAAAALFGCSPESYRDSADLQVRQILRDREQSTLGYTPAVTVEKDIPATPKKSAYAKIPVSPIPPATTPPLQPLDMDLPATPLGPELRWAEPMDEDGYGVSLDASVERWRQDMALGPPVPDQMVRRFDLFDILDYAASNSPAYKTEMERLYLSALDVTLERHLFSPRPFVQQSLRFTGNQSDYNAALTATTSAGVRQQLPYGGEIVAQTLVDFVNTVSGNVNEGESARVALSGSIPLLRGAGLVNLEPLISSERGLIYDVRSFEDYRRSFVVSIASRYFRLIQTQQAVTNRRLQLANLVALTGRTRALFEAGRISFLEVQRSLQSQLSAQNALIDSEQAYKAEIDDFKLTIGMPVDKPLEIAGVRLDVEIPKASTEEAVVLAHQYRLDLRTAADRLEDAQRGVKNARNGLLPDLDLTAAGNVRSDPEEGARDLRGDTVDYSAGLTLDLPVDRLAERNSYRRALIGFQRTERDFVLLRDRISNQVRDSLRAIQGAELTLEIQRRGIELAQRRLEFSSELLRQGKVNARDLVEAQTDLLDAQDRFESAKSTLQIRVLEYLRDTGTLRVDPAAGAIGRAMSRESPPVAP